MNRDGEKGQALVEYLLLMAVVVLFASLMFRNRSFQAFLGENSTFFAFIRENVVYSYRYARNGRDDGGIAVDYSAPTSHPSYMNSGGESRFFSGRDPYGKPL